MTSCPEAMGWDSQWFWIKAVSWDLDLDEASWFLGEAGPVMDCGVRTRVGWVSELRADDGRTVSIEKLCVSLSPCVEKLNLKKVIKFSYLNQESRQCFVFFGFLCVWTLYEHSMNICTFHIFVYWSYFWPVYYNTLKLTLYQMQIDAQRYTYFPFRIFIFEAKILFKKKKL